MKFAGICLELRVAALRLISLDLFSLSMKNTLEPKFQVTSYFDTLTGLLRDRHGFMAQISQDIGLKQKIVSLLFVSSAFFAVYGFIIGSFHSGMQSLSSAVKLPSLYLITMAVCLPTLYFFNILFGSRKSFTQHFAIVLAAVSAISVLLFSFAPISLFFLVTTPNYQFFKLLNVAILGLTGFVGVKFLYQGMQLMSETEADEEGKENRQKLLKGWLFLYAFVGSQLGWTLRPFFGTPGKEFELFREMGGNFYFDIVNAILSVLGLK